MLVDWRFDVEEGLVELAGLLDGGVLYIALGYPDRAGALLLTGVFDMHGSLGLAACPKCCVQ